MKQWHEAELHPTGKAGVAATRVGDHNCRLGRGNREANGPSEKKRRQREEPEVKTSPVKCKTSPVKCSGNATAGRNARLQSTFTAWRQAKGGALALGHALDLGFKIL